MQGGDYFQEKAFEGGVSWFRGIEEGARAVSPEEGGGGHVSAVEDIFLLDFGGVKEDGEANSIENSDYLRIGGDEGPRGHVGSKDGGFVFLDTCTKEGVLALVVEVVAPVFDRTDEGQSTSSGDLF